MINLVFRNTATGIFYVKVKPLCTTFIAQSNATFIRKLHRVGHKIGDNLLQAVSICIHNTFIRRSFSDNLDNSSFIFQSHTEQLFYIKHQLLDVHLRERKLQCTCFYFRKVKNISNQLLQ